MCCFSAKHEALRRKRKDWLARNQNYVLRVERQVNLRTVVSACCSRNKRTSSSSHWKLSYSRHDIAEKMLKWRIITITHSNSLVKFTINKTEILLKVTLNTITQLHNINILNSAYASLLSNRKWDSCAHFLIAGYDQKTSVNSATTHSCLSNIMCSLQTAINPFKFISILNSWELITLYWITYYTCYFII